MRTIIFTDWANWLIFWLDMLGTVAFAISGVLRGWQRKFNFVGGRLSCRRRGVRRRNHPRRAPGPPNPVLSSESDLYCCRVPHGRRDVSASAAHR